jgi:hypothetical protein
MAKFTPLLGGISGKLGAAVFTRTNIVRAPKITSPPRDPLQKRWYNYMARLYNDAPNAYKQFLDHLNAKHHQPLDMCNLSPMYRDIAVWDEYELHKPPKGLYPTTMSSKHYGWVSSQQHCSGGARLFEEVGEWYAELIWPDLPAPDDSQYFWAMGILNISHLNYAMEEGVQTQITSPIVTRIGEIFRFTVPYLKGEFLSGTMLMILIDGFKLDAVGSKMGTHWVHSMQHNCFCITSPWQVDVPGF